MEKVSHKVQQEVMRLLPGMRGQVKEELLKCGSVAGKEFYSDEKILEVLPYAAYETLILSWKISPEILDMDTVVMALDTSLFSSLPKIVGHALRRLGKVPS